MKTEKNDIQILRDIVAKEIFVTSQEEVLSFSRRESNGWIFDTKKVLLRANFLSSFARLFWERCDGMYPFQVGGLELGALPLISAIVLEGERRGRQVNGFFIRKSRKKTGRMKRVEGEVNDLSVILVDDIVNTGGSFELQYETLQKERPGVRVVGLFSLITFRDEYPFFSQRGVEAKSLFSLSDLQKDVPAFLHEKELPPATNPHPILFAKKVSGADHTLLSERGGVAFSNNSIFFGTDSGEVYALCKKTGELLWTYQIPGFTKRKGVIVTPLFSEGRIFTASLNGCVVALSEQGEVLWKRCDGDEVLHEMLFSKKEHVLFVVYSHKNVPSQNEIVAYRVTTGEIVWSRKHAGRLTRRMSLGAKSDAIFLATEEGGVCALSVSTGKLLWSCVLPLARTSSPLCANDGSVIIVGSSKEEDGIFVYKLSQKNGKILSLSSKLLIGIVADTSLYRNTLFLSSQDHTLSFFDLENNIVVKSYDLGSRMLCAPSVVKRGDRSVVFIGANDGRLHEIDIESGERKSITYFTERLLSTAVESDGVLYVKTAGGEIIGLMLG